MQFGFWQSHNQLVERVLVHNHSYLFSIRDRRYLNALINPFKYRHRKSGAEGILLKANSKDTYKQIPTN
ncbi:hypothetical protein [Deefgea sp. CFH1-16]|uniref:hypothetical protein n=1 Tax=Deefgea sp. CFH1-16 TaxID=2675457 RepID=UPI0015F785E7|nr:hypothetical protein [Deefgea sp. CFH1-16]